MAEKVKILHRLYSHALFDFWSTRGWNNVRVDDRDAVDFVPAQVLRELDDLMSKISPSSAGPGWVVRRYAADDDTYACVIVSYGDVVVDDSDRPALLTHARLVCVPATQAWFDAAALVELAQGLAIQNVRAVSPNARVHRYLELIRAESAIAIREVTRADLNLPRSFLCDALVGWLAAIGKQQQIRVALPAPEVSLIGDLARAWAAMPLALQRTSAWAIGVKDGCPVDVIFANASGNKAKELGSDTLIGFVARYVNLFLDSPYDFSLLLSNPEMTTTARLNEALQKAEPLTLLRDVAPAPSGKNELKKNPTDETQIASRGELDNETTMELDRQYRAMEASLRTYIDQRFEALENRVPPRDQVATIPWTWQRVLAVFAAIILTAVTATSVTIFVMRPAKKLRRTAIDSVGTDTSKTSAPTETTQTMDTDEVAGTDTAAEAALQTAAQNLVKAAATDQRWAGGLFELVKTNGSLVAAKIDQSTSNRAPEDAVRKQWDSFSSKIKAGKIGSGRGEVDPVQFRAVLLKIIDKDIKPDNLGSLRKNKCAKSTDNNPITLQGEIILRWLAGESCQ